MTDVEITRRVVWLTRLLGVGGLVLIGVTWRLWTPQDVFPRVPLFWWAPPHWLDWTGLAITLAGLVTLAGHRSPRIAAAITACGFAILFLSDQHRLQPWAWQFFILATVIALGDDRTVFYGWRWLVVSIYFWSALSKFDVEFVNSIAPWLLRPLTQLLRIAQIPLRWHKGLLDEAESAVLAIPIGELAIAVLLITGKTRRAGLYGSWFMHLALIALLGPAGKNHSLGVVFWNALFVFQNQLLFRAREGDSTALADSPNLLTPRTVMARCILGFTLLWPALEPWGYCDPWLGWAVYVPRFQRAEIWLNPNEIPELPPRLKIPSTALPGVDLGRWSVQALGAPTYPHHRFVTACAIELSGESGGQTRLSLFVRARRNRWTSDFSSEKLTIYQGREAIEAYARTFRLNAFPESWYHRIDSKTQTRGD